MLDLMERLNRGESEEFHHFVPSQEFLDSLKSKLDTNQPVISGHSFGGATMVKALLEKVCLVQAFSLTSLGQTKEASASRSLSFFA